MREKIGAHGPQIEQPRPDIRLQRLTCQKSSVSLLQYGRSPYTTCWAVLLAKRLGEVSKRQSRCPLYPAFFPKYSLNYCPFFGSTMHTYAYQHANMDGQDFCPKISINLRAVSVLTPTAERSVAPCSLSLRASCTIAFCSIFKL